MKSFLKTLLASLLLVLALTPPSRAQIYLF